ncbi:MAG: hypothetical protein HY223_04145 [Thaumarchaeota archaeon]|nr:hypothetical protein [Nitrososphaerota archaeon]
MKKMQCNVLSEICEQEIQSDVIQEEMSCVDIQTSKIIQICAAEFDRILDPFL